MASKRRNMFYENKKQETTEIGVDWLAQIRQFATNSISLTNETLTKALGPTSELRHDIYTFAYNRLNGNSKRKFNNSFNSQKTHGEPEDDQHRVVECEAGRARDDAAEGTAPERYVLPPIPVREKPVQV
ncbi:hypothetical protein AAG570_010235 [Ranatra chinensis]|uniref:Uncharacterized protein n=1 Tax=Ranatra chinensis TaxID=642074 RepID=A0ABD0Z836_9HEMI